MATDPLKKYREKRSASRTPEPFTGGGSGGQIFVVQKHAARRMHYDFRLEANGVLWSWAVPNGPSRNPADKQLAVHVEDHPVEYAEFEGIIPKDNYGAGAVIVWDRGTFTFLEDPEGGLEKGKLLFELRGQKLRGRWTLVKIKKAEKEWLLIKERDGFAAEQGQDFPEDSVLSGLTVEELRDGRSPADDIVTELRTLKAPERPVQGESVELMLAETVDKPFTRAGWLFELKYDGYRLVAAKARDRSRLITRNGNDATDTFPEIARALAALPFEHVVLDGEVVVQDETGKPSFQRLQQRGRYLQSSDRQAALEHQATFFAFDLLGFGNFDLRALPLVERKRLLRRVLPSAGFLRFADHIETRGEDFFRAAENLELEGIVAKKSASKYKGGRSNEWFKIRIDKSDDFVIVGYTAPRGSRTAFGALQLGIYRDGELTYAGSVGTGFTDKQLREIKKLLDPHIRATPPLKYPPPGKGNTWVEPLFVCEVRFKEWTDEPLLRHPAFLRMRDDKKPSECVVSSMHADVDEPEISAPAPAPAAAKVEIVFSNLDKVLFPADGYTKSDLIEYYRGISSWLLPYLHDRPVTLTRYPDGIAGKSFFQKDAPDWTPEWVRTEKMWSEEAEREVRQFICDDENTLLYLANSATIPLHIASSRLGSVERPDWCSLDLDPKDAPFESVIAVAQTTRALCAAIDLPCFVKTTGSSGLHVLIPLGRQVTHDQAKQLGELLARAIVKREPALATVERVISKRAGKVYVDFLQNGHGKLLVSPFCVRPLDGAPVSMPLDWSEVVPGLSIKDYTIANAVPRMRERGDPLRDVLELRPDLLGALRKLADAL
jgi:bifunctional non-homologous end joining protein LigD